MELLEDTSLDFIDYTFFESNTSNDFSWLNQSAGVEDDLSPNFVVSQEKESTRKSAGVEDDLSPNFVVSQEKESTRKSAGVEDDLSPNFVVSQEKESTRKSAGVEDDLSPNFVVPQEKESTRKRGRTDLCCKLETKACKACREKSRRERLNDRFLELNSILEPGRPAKSDKGAILADAIRVLNQLKTEAQELRESNEKLQEEIKTLKDEKNILREEKSALKTDTERMKQKLKAMTSSPTGFMPTHPAAYHAGASKFPVFPGYGLVPMWQYLPSSAVDTSHDHELRPPAA